MKFIFQKLLHTSSFSIFPVSGGDINDAYKISTENGDFFIKSNTYPEGFSMLQAEFNALRLLTDHNVNVPSPIKAERVGKQNFLILEWIETGRSNSKSNQNIAEELSKLHSIKSDKFGFGEDNFIGRLTQKNSFCDDWLTFYRNERIDFQLKMAVDSGLISTDYIRKMEKMFQNMEKEFPNVVPTLLHGDLWGGNYLTDTQGKCIFIDPAIYFGHNEVDVAMMKLFGGFPEEVFSAYNEISSLEKNWKDRLRFYQLYFILAHVNLFGSSYVNSACSIIDYHS